MEREPPSTPRGEGAMAVIDADAHVEEWAATFSDKYLDPAFRARRPEVVATESLELREPAARLADMDREGLDLQVIYPTLFLARLTEDPALAAALCASYNRWLGDVLGGQERLKWVGIVALDDPAAAAREVRQAKELGAVGIIIHGTAGTRMANHAAPLPFWGPG